MPPSGIPTTHPAWSRPMRRCRAYCWLALFHVKRTSQRSSLPRLRSSARPCGLASRASPSPTAHAPIQASCSSSSRRRTLHPTGRSETVPSGQGGHGELVSRTSRGAAAAVSRGNDRPPPPKGRARRPKSSDVHGIYTGAPRSPHWCGAFHVKDRKRQAPADHVGGHGGFFAFSRRSQPAGAVLPSAVSPVQPTVACNDDDHVTYARDDPSAGQHVSAPRRPPVGATACCRRCGALGQRTLRGAARFT